MDNQPTPGGKMTLFITALVSTCMTLLALIPVAYMAFRQIPPQLVTVDLQKIVEEDQSRLIDFIGAAGGSVTAEKRALGEKMTADFAHRLSKGVDQLSAECHCVIINKAALLSGTAIDYTDLLKERIKK